MTVNVSKTFEFNPSLGEIVITAFGRCQVRAPELTASHMYQARIAANLVLSEWSNVTPNLWEVALQTVPLVEGAATYTVPAETVMILDAVVSTGSPTEIDLVIFPISRTEYMSFPDKEQAGTPNVFWFDRLVSPTITLWPVPDSGGPYTLKYYSVRQTMDAELANGLNVEVPYRYLDAFVCGLAWRLSETYAPQMEDKLFMRYQRAMNIANTQDVENVSLIISPGIGGYYK